MQFSVANRLFSARRRSRGLRLRSRRRWGGLIRFERLFAENLRPAVGVVGDVFCFSDVGVERVVAECGANAGDADEDDFCPRCFAGLDDGAGFAFWLAVEEVVAADADSKQ